jgi:cobalt-zinc-cadmium efflux system membrane fusion protein
MKIFPSFIVLVSLTYFALMCSKGPGDEHDHDDQAHPSSATQEHEHSSDNRTHDKQQPIEHVEDAAHTLEGHEHTEPEHNHDHEHDHAAEGFITVEGDWEKLVGLETTVARIDAIERLVTVPGQIVPNQNAVAIVSPFIEGSVNCAFVNLGDRVEIGDELVCLTSPQIGISRAEYDKAKAELEIRRQNFERRQKLFKENIISERAFQEAELSKNIAEVNYNYAMKKLLAIGITEDELDHPPTGHSNAIGSTIHIHAPISGVITSRDASVGQKVDPSTRLYEIINLETVWCEADIFEKDLTRVKIGQKVRINVSAYPDQYFIGKIFYIASTLNPDTKTIKILIEIDNRSKKLKPGMFANTNLVVGQKQDALVIPRNAVLEDEQLHVVFVKEPGGYHRHVVQTGIVSDPFIEILDGLAPGDIIVTKGNYQLRSKQRMGGVDPHAGHVH